MNPPSSQATFTKVTTTAKRSQESDVFAALDLGTNNCRLLIARKQTGLDTDPMQLEILESFSRIVRLGEGLSDNDSLSEDAMKRTIEALKICQRKLQKFPQARRRLVATEACRRASNRVDFIQRVKREAKLDIEIIDGEEEAGLAFKGCASLLKPSPHKVLVFDIGGGSTELMWVQIDATQPSNQPILQHKILDWFPLPHGVMNLSEKFGGPAFTEVYFEEMVNYLVQQLSPFDHAESIAAAAQAKEIQLLSTSGTVTTLAAIYLGLPRYERSKIDGITLSTSKLRQATGAILSMRASERFHHPCIGADRSDYIISGCAILEAIRRLWPVKDITIADRGVREGIIMSLMAEQQVN